MPENLAHFRTSEKTPVLGLHAYRFVERAIPIPDDPAQGDWAAKLVQYESIAQKIQSLQRQNIPVPTERISERQALHVQIDRYLTRRLTEYRKSVLKASLGQKSRLDERGKDSHVFYYGPLEDFLSEPNTPRYVTKYSIPKKAVTEKNVEYLAKKYKILDI
ncbi:hypothetical protein HY417_03565 [Candidatus Kaiserbacteria bacterium]|nr:hypothetical protein [Candidatus Kaiserbacteria bacterium]